MRVYIDWEFLEDGVTIKPISVGMVREDAVGIYYEFIDAPWSDILKHEWLKENVVPGLSDGLNKAIVTGEGTEIVKSKLAIRMKIYDFLQEANYLDPGNLELWGWYSAYDHVCLAQLFGKMIDLPDFVPMWTNDLRQEFYRTGVQSWPEQLEGNHNALLDAIHIKDMHGWYMKRQSAVKINNSRGFQYGNGNTQFNTF